jgi:hypothetical protein
MSAMVQASYDLPEETVASLEAWASAHGWPASFALQSAIAEFVGRQHMTSDEWLAELRKLQAEVAAHMPAGVTPEEIEAEIDAATHEAWAERRAARRR